jgi:hypothetical protein
VIIPESAVEAVALVLADVEGDSQTCRALARDVIAAAVPHIRASERARIAELIEPGRLELLAAWFDAHDAALGGGHGHEVQRDLRLWAAILRGGEPGPASVSEVLLGATQSLGLAGK